MHFGVKAAFPGHAVKTIGETSWRSSKDGPLLTYAQERPGLLNASTAKRANLLIRRTGQPLLAGREVLNKSQVSSVSARRPGRPPQVGDLPHKNPKRPRPPPASNTPFRGLLDAAA